MANKRNTTSSARSTNTNRKKSSSKTAKKSSRVSASSPFRKYRGLLTGLAFVLVMGVIGYQLHFFNSAAATPAPVKGPGGMCLDNYANLKRENNAVNLFTCNGTDAQNWVVNSGTTIVNANGYCLTASGTTSGSRAVIAKCTGKANQNWTINAQTHTIVSAASKLCLDDYANLVKDYNKIWVYTCNGTTAQVWLPQTVVTPTPPPTTTPKPTPTPPQTAGLPLLGADTRGDSQATWDAFENQVGNLFGRRTYDGALPTWSSANMKSDIANKVVSFWSFKPTPKTFASGSQDAAFKSLLASIPAGHQTYITLWHEPEDQLKAGSFTLADWKAANNRMGAMINATGRSELHSMIVLMGPWTFSPSSPYSKYDFWDPGFANNLDAIGIDPYTTDGKFNDIATMGGTTQMMNFIHSHNKPFGITEIGAHQPVVNATTDKQKGDWISRQWAWAKANKAICFLYFNINASKTLTDRQSNIIQPGSPSEAAYRKMTAEANQ